MEHHFNVEIAKKYGIEEAILIHHFYFWIAKNAANNINFLDGLYWTYSSRKMYASYFIYMNETKIFRAIKTFIDDGILIKGHYNKDKFDRTNWYALTPQGLEYLSLNGYSMTPFQNDHIDCVKMNNGLCQNEQSYIIYNISSSNQIVNTNNKKEKELNKFNSQKKFDFSFVQPDFLPIVNEWMEYKIEIKDAYKGQRGLTAFYNKLFKLSNGNAAKAKEIIEQSMANNWKGIFPLQDKQPQSNRNNMPTGMILDNEQERARVIAESKKDLW